MPKITFNSKISVNSCGYNDHFVVQFSFPKNPFEAKIAKRRFATKIKVTDILTRIFVSRFKLRFAQPFKVKFK